MFTIGIKQQLFGITCFFVLPLIILLMMLVNRVEKKETPGSDKRAFWGRWRTSFLTWSVIFIVLFLIDIILPETNTLFYEYLLFLFPIWLHVVIFFDAAKNEPYKNKMKVAVLVMFILLHIFVLGVSYRTIRTVGQTQPLSSEVKTNAQTKPLSSEVEEKDVAKAFYRQTLQGFDQALAGENGDTFVNDKFDKIKNTIIHDTQFSFKPKLYDYILQSQKDGNDLLKKYSPDGLLSPNPADKNLVINKLLSSDDFKNSDKTILKEFLRDSSSPNELKYFLMN